MTAGRFVEPDAKQGRALSPLPFQRSKRIVGTFDSYAQTHQG